MLGVKGSNCAISLPKVELGSKVHKQAAGCHGDNLIPLASAALSHCPDAPLARSIKTSLLSKSFVWSETFINISMISNS